MSNTISRRNFLKFAGASVLAVSAAGMLTGCVGGIPVTVIYNYKDAPVAKTTTVAKSPVLKAASLKLPKGYALEKKLRAKDAVVKISEENFAQVDVVKTEEFTVKYSLLPADSTDTFADKKLTLPSDVTTEELYETLDAKTLAPSAAYEEGVIDLVGKTINIVLVKKETAKA